MNKQFDLLIDTKRTSFNTVRGLKEGDNNSVLNITLVQNSIPFDLTDLTVRINYKRPDNKIFLQMADITNAMEGEININILTKVLSLAGEVRADLSIFDKDNRKITSVTFSMFIDTSVYSNDYIEQEDLDLIQDIYSKEKERQENEIGRVQEESRRIQQEMSRQELEKRREIKEKERQQNETERQSNEDKRLKNEVERIRNELLRQTNEKERLANETLRKNNERVREDNEKERLINESERQDNETKREQTHNVLKETISNINKIEQYNTEKEYKKLNRVTFNGSSYECLKDCTGIEPTNEEYWICIAEKGKDGTGVGDMLKEVYDKNNNGVVDLAEKANSVEWSNIENAPNLDEIGKVKSVNGKTGEVVLKADDISTSRNKTVEQELTGNRQTLLNLTNNKADQDDFEILEKQVKANFDLINAPGNITLYVDGVNGSNFGSHGLSEDKPLRSLDFAFDRISHFHKSATIYIIGDVTLTWDIFLNCKIADSLSITITTKNGSKIKSDGERAIYVDNVSWIKLEQLNITGVSINARFNTAVFLKNCTFANNTTAVSSLYGSCIIVESCSFSGSTYACMAAKTCGKIHSSYNTGNSVKYGLVAYEGGVISKQGSQPTGSQANEYTVQGGVIR
ncbi:hypothetical protein K144316041_p20400 (plasmid) [Clostridium tetani]|uniref:BppU family phage baseplate upper protein n=1 Tax=Clostridium tetani TaxID=1513 RepID=UPI0029539F42|nr:BppU family phage baseplate upper protein [Clostridium tetani]BDR74201.1 hypothetical protein K144316041_p20400 [Clostridium tetani]